MRRKQQRKRLRPLFFLARKNYNLYNERMVLIMTDKTKEVLKKAGKEAINVFIHVYIPTVLISATCIGLYVMAGGSYEKNRR